VRTQRRGAWRRAGGLENIRKFLTYILTSNVPELVPYLAFAFPRFRSP
jgi:hypothetical protein